MCLSVCHMRISPKLSEIDIWLLGNSNRKPRFPIQNLSSDSRSGVPFCQFGRFWVAGHRSGSAIVTSHSRRYLVFYSVPVWRLPVEAHLNSDLSGIWIRAHYQRLFYESVPTERTFVVCPICCLSVFSGRWTSVCGGVCGRRLRCSSMCRALVVGLLATERSLLPV